MKKQLEVVFLSLMTTGWIGCMGMSDRANASVPNELQGEWQHTEVSATQYFNQSAWQSGQNASAPTNGLSDNLKIAPDGSYERNRLMQITTYGCESSIYVQEVGTVVLENDQLMLQPSHSLSRGQQCSPDNTSEQENTVEPSVFNWAIGTNDSGEGILVLEYPESGEQSQYKRVE
jgi:hypothetical protein